jgi:regulator of RNase E activity RraA
MTLGFRVLRRHRAVPNDLVARFRALPVANVSDSMSRMTAAGPRLTKMHAHGVLAGAALTVKTRPGAAGRCHRGGWRRRADQFPDG